MKKIFLITALLLCFIAESQQKIGYTRNKTYTTVQRDAIDISDTTLTYRLWNSDNDRWERYNHNTSLWVEDGGSGATTTINNTLTSTSTDEALSAAQGKVLKDVQDTQQTSIDLNTAKTTFPGFTSLFADYAFTDNSTNWNTAFGWGDHSLSGYSTGAHTVDTDTQLPLIDDDTFATATATNVPSAESVKALVDANSGGDIEGISSSGTVAGSDVVLALGIYGDNDAGIQIDTDTNQIEVTANGGGSLISTGGDINLSGLNVNVKNLKVLDNDGVVLNNTANTFATTLINSEQTANYNLTIPVLTQNSTVALASDIPTLIDDDTFATATATNVPSAESVKALVDANSGGDIEGISSSGTVAGSDVVLALGIYGDNDAGIQIDTDTNQIEVTANGGGSLISTGGDINLSGLNVNVKNLKVLDNDGVVLNNTANTFATTLINSEQTANYNLTIPVLTQNSTVALASDIPTLIDDDTFATATATNVASAESIKAYVDDLASKELLINSITASSRDFEVADTNGMNIIANTGNITLTVPDNIAMPLPIGSVIPLTRQKGSTGTVTIAYAAGVTGEAGFLYTDRDWGSLVKTAENTWILVSFPYTDLSAIGGGDVTKVGTPINNQFALWTGDGTVEGDAWFKADTVSDTAFRRIQIGLDDTVAGYLELFGHADNTANSGVSLYTNAGVGTEVQKYNIITDTISGDLLIQGTGGTGGGTYLVFDAATGAITAPNAEIADITSLGAKALMTSEAVDDRITPTTETGVALVLDNPLGKYYNMASANAGTTYTFSGQVVGGWAMCLINTTSEPVVTGATKIAGATWVTGTDMNLVVRHNGAATQYFFTKI